VNITCGTSVRLKGSDLINAASKWLANREAKDA
jgi:hypothetical protein